MNGALARKALVAQLLLTTIALQFTQKLTLALALQMFGSEEQQRTQQKHAALTAVKRWLLLASSALYIALHQRMLTVTQRLAKHSSAPVE